MQPCLQTGVCSQCRCAGCKRGPKSHASSCIQTPCAGQFQYACIDGRIHAKIVGADDNTLFLNFDHALPFGNNDDAKTCVATGRSEEHTSELQSLMRISYAVFCLKKKKHQ